MTSPWGDEGEVCHTGMQTSFTFKYTPYNRGDAAAYSVPRFFPCALCSQLVPIYPVGQLTTPVLDTLQTN